MSTRSVTVIDQIDYRWDWESRENKEGREHIARFYRHMDGYPEGHGLQMAIALASCSMNEYTNNRNWAQPFLRILCGMDMDIEFEPTSAALGAWAHGDLDYSYRITGRADYTGGKEDDPDASDNVAIEVFGSWRGADGDADWMDGEEPIFKGNWRDYVRWIESEQPGYITDLEYDEEKPSAWIYKGALDANGLGNVRLASTADRY